VIAVDTNILARFYCDDPHDKQSKLQRPLARRTLLESPSIFVPLTVVLELEWVMRGFYEFEPESFCQSMEHLLGISRAWCGSNRCDLICEDLAAIATGQTVYFLWRPCSRDPDDDLVWQLLHQAKA